MGFGHHSMTCAGVGPSSAPKRWAFPAWLTIWAIVLTIAVHALAPLPESKASQVGSAFSAWTSDVSLAKVRRPTVELESVAEPQKDDYLQPLHSSACLPSLPITEDRAAEQMVQNGAPRAPPASLHFQPVLPRAPPCA